MSTYPTRFEATRRGCSGKARSRKDGPTIASYYLRSPSTASSSSSNEDVQLPKEHVSSPPQLFVHDPYQTTVALRPCPEWQTRHSEREFARSYYSPETEACGISSTSSSYTDRRSSLACGSELSIEAWEDSSCESPQECQAPENFSPSLFVSLSRPIPTHEIKEIFTQFGEAKVKPATIAKFNWRGIVEFNNEHSAQRAQAALNCTTLRDGCVASVWDASETEYQN